MKTTSLGWSSKTESKGGKTNGGEKAKGELENEERGEGDLKWGYYEGYEMAFPRQ